MAGFTSGEGYFHLGIRPSKELALGFQVILIFQLTQHVRDEQLMRRFEVYFDCGKSVKTSRAEVYFNVSKFSDINEKIMPFFHKYKIRGVKYADFND